MKTCSQGPALRSRNSIEDIWGPRTPYVHEWPVRVDMAADEEPQKWIQSACILCSNGCGMDIGVSNGKVVGVRGRATDRVNKGRLGPKGLTGWKALHSKDRLTHPLIRRNGKLEKASWDEAMGLIVQKSKKLIDSLTAHSIAFYTSGQLFLEEYYALALIGKAGLQTLHMDGNTRLCTATAAASMRESFGSDGQPASYTDIDYTDCIMLVGHNMAATQTVLWSRILDRLSGPKPPKLIVIDPRYSETASKATVHLIPRIGTNLALLNGLQHLLFKNEYINRSYVDKHVVGLEALENLVSEYNPEKVEKITGVPASKLREAADILGSTPTLLSTALQGVYQSNQATASACQINNINLLRGLIGKPGSGILQMNGQPTAQNNREAGCDGEFPGFRNHMNPAHFAELARLWNLDPIRIPHWNEPTHIENMLKYMHSGSIRMIWVSGTNPLVSLPNLPTIREIFTQPELFVVCQDIYMTETASVADVVLPAAQWGEKTGCFTNVDRTVHISHKAVEPPGEAKSDLDIFLDYGRRMGFKDKDGQDLLPWTEPEEVFNAWKRISAGRPCDYTGLTYDLLSGGSGIQWPCNAEYPRGKERLFEDGVFFTDFDMCESFGHNLETGAPFSADDYRELNPAGRAIFKTCHYLPSYEEPNDEYPFRLSTGRNVYHFHTRTKTGRTALQSACPEPHMRVSEEDAAELALENGDMVLVKSRRGAVELQIDVGRIGKGQVFVPFHFGYWDSKDGRARAANELTTSEWDPISKQPTFKSGAVSITKLGYKASEESGSREVTAKEGQSDAISAAGKKDAVTSTVTEEDLAKRQRHLESWLTDTQEAVEVLDHTFQLLIPKLPSDSDAHLGLRALHLLCGRIGSRFGPQMGKLGARNQIAASKDGGTPSKARALHDTLFRHLEDAGDMGLVDVLATLRALQVLLAHIQACLTALLPVSQALWDEEFFEAVKCATRELEKMQSWVRQQLSVRAPQTLLVPALS